MTRSKRIGTAWETVCVIFWKPFYPWIERRALQGAKDKGDLTHPSVVIECKAAKTLRLADWLNELDAEMVNADTEYGFLHVKRIGKSSGADGYIVMRPQVAARLMKEAGL